MTSELFIIIIFFGSKERWCKGWDKIEFIFIKVESKRNTGTTEMERSALSENSDSRNQDWKLLRKTRKDPVIYEDLLWPKKYKNEDKVLHQSRETSVVHKITLLVLLSIVVPVCQVLTSRPKLLTRNFRLLSDERPARTFPFRCPP